MRLGGLTPGQVCVREVGLKEHGLSRLEAHVVEEVRREAADVARELLTQPQDQLPLHVRHVLASSA